MNKKDFKKIIDENQLMKFGSEDVSGISKWVDESGDLVSNIVAGGDLFADWDWIGDNTYTKRMQVLDVTPDMTNGNCVTTAGGTVSFTKRDIVVDLFTDRQEICTDVLKEYFPAMKYQGKGAMYDDLEYSAEIVAEKSAQIQKLIEQLAFTGVSATDGEVNGILTIADTETGSLGDYGTHSALTTGTNVIDKVDTMVAALPDNIVDKELIMYMSTKYATLCIQGLIESYGDYINRENPFRTNGLIRFRYPKFQNLTIIGTHGLTGNDSIIMTNGGNLKYSGDLEGDSGEVYVEANRWHQQVLLLTKFFLGFNYLYPENVVYSKKV